MEKVEIRKIIEDIIITQFLNSEMDIVHENEERKRNSFSFNR